MKSFEPVQIVQPVPVTSLAEVWIEIEQLQSGFDFGVVTSLAEVWIEIKKKFTITKSPSHFPRGSVD